MHSRQFELSGDYWTDRFIAAHEWVTEEAKAEEAKKNREGVADTSKTTGEKAVGILAKK